jgi:hypothetical protein
MKDSCGGNELERQFARKEPAVPALTVPDITVPGIAVLPRIAELDPAIARQSRSEYGGRSA